MKRRRPVLILLVLALSLAAAGCWDRSELEEEAYVLAIGVDKGETALYSVTFAIALPGKMAGGGGKGGGGGGGGDEKPYMLTTVEAPTVAGAIGMANSYLDRQVSIRHTKALFLGEDLARVSGMHAMDEFARYRQGRRSVFYIVTKGKAADFLDGLQPKMEKDPQRFIEQLTYNYRRTGTIPASSQIQDFISKVNTGYSAPVTYYAALKEESEEKSGSGASLWEVGFKAGDLPRKGGPNVELVGGAAFKGEKMVGVLTGEDVRMALLLQDRFERGFFSIPDPEQEGLFVSLELHQGRPMTLGVDLSGQKPRLTGVITLEGEILSIQSNRDYTDPALQSQLEAAAASTISQRIRTLITKTQEWGTDAVGFGEEVVKQFPTVAEWERFDWPNRYKDASVDIRVRVTIRRFGKQLSPPMSRQ